MQRVKPNYENLAQLTSKRRCQKRRFSKSGDLRLHTNTWYLLVFAQCNGGIAIYKSRSKAFFNKKSTNLSGLVDDYIITLAPIAPRYRQLTWLTAIALRFDKRPGKTLKKKTRAVDHCAQMSTASGFFFRFFQVRTYVLVVFLLCAMQWGYSHLQEQVEGIFYPQNPDIRGFFDVFDF